MTNLTLPPPQPQPRVPQTIRIDPEVWSALQKLAVPFVETPNHVLRRLLGLNNPAVTSETPPALPLKKHRAETYFLNTDAVSYGGHSYHEEWLRRGIAVTSGPRKFRDKLARIGRDDIVLMYVNGEGVLAAGIALDDGISDVRDGTRVSKNNEVEYHRRVAWTRLSKAIDPATLKNLCGRPPRQTVERVGAEAEKALSGLLAAAGFACPPTTSQGAR